MNELVLGKTQNRQEILQHSAQPVENAKSETKETNALVSACRSRIFGCRVLEQTLNLSSRDVRPLTNSDCLGYNESRK